MSKRTMSDEKTSSTAGESTFMTPEEVAIELRVSRMTVYRVMHSGALFSIRVGRGYRVPRAAYNDYIKGASYVPPIWADGSGE